MKKSDSELKTIKWISLQAKRFIPLIFLLSICGIIVSAIGIAQAWCYREIIDGVEEVIATNVYDGLIKNAVFFVIIVVVRIMMSLISKYTDALAGTGFYNELRHKIMTWLFAKDYKSISGYHTGEILNRMFSDAKIVSSNTIALLPSLIGLAVKLIGSVIFLFFISKEYCIFLLIAGASMGIFATLMRKKMKHLHKDVQAADGKVRSAYQEQVMGLLMIKIFGADKKMLCKSDELQTDYKKTVLQQRLFNCVVNLGYTTVYNMGILLAFFFSVYGIINGFMTYGSLTAMMQLVSSIQSSVSDLSGIIPTIYSTTASAERIIELENIPNEICGESAVSDISEISYNDLYFSYGRNDVLNGINVKIKKGETVAIQGLSGSGKSTMLLLLLGIYSPDSGNIIITGNDGAKAEASRNTRTLFSYIPQGNQLFSGTVLDNILFAKECASEVAIKEALQISCADEFISEFPNGINTVIGEHGIGLSEGQQQRIAIARAILSDAPCILFDEATSALDEITEKRLIENLEKINKTCILITHRKSPLSICNKAYVLSEQGIYQVKENENETF